MKFKHIFIMILITSGVLYAGPQSITIINQSGEDTDFEIVLSNGQRRTTPQGPNLRQKEFSFNTPISSVRNRKNTVFLDIHEYSEHITLVYDGNTLLEQSAYTIHTQSFKRVIPERVTTALQSVAARLSAVMAWGGSVLSNFRTLWRQQRGMSSPYGGSDLLLTTVKNELDFEIAISAGEYLVHPVEIAPGKTGSVSFKLNPVYVYKAKDLRINSGTYAETIIDVAKYQKNPKLDSELYITVKKSRWPEWMIKRGLASAYTYTIEWQKIEFNSSTEFGYE